MCSVWPHSSVPLVLLTIIYSTRMTSAHLHFFLFSFLFISILSTSFYFFPSLTKPLVKWMNTDRSACTIIGQNTAHRTQSHIRYTLFLIHSRIVGHTHTHGFVHELGIWHGQICVAAPPFGPIHFSKTMVIIFHLPLFSIVRFASARASPYSDREVD